MRTIPMAGVCVSLLAIASQPAMSAEPIQWLPEEGGNGHYYLLVMPSAAGESFTWTEARDAAAASTYRGSQGHLVTVTSAEEDEFLEKHFTKHLFDNWMSSDVGRKFAWIGLFAETPMAEFQWVTGEDYCYTNWARNEPNLRDTPKWQYVHYWNRDFGNGDQWSWNNEEESGEFPLENRFGYIVEYDGPFTAPAARFSDGETAASSGITIVAGPLVILKPSFYRPIWVALTTMPEEEDSTPEDQERTPPLFQIVPVLLGLAVVMWLFTRHRGAEVDPGNSDRHRKSD